MAKAFTNGSAKVLVIDGSGSARQLIGDVIRGMGFHDVVVASSGRDALGLLEREAFDWLIMPTMRQEDVNALHLLKLLSESPTLSRLRVSLIYEAADEPLLETAFALGLMSCHPRTDVRDELHRELTRLIGVLKLSEWRSVLTAAEYLRPLLLKNSRFADLIDMERKLLALYPGSSPLLLKLGETQLRSGEIQNGVSTLRQAAILDEKTKDAGQDLMHKLLNVSITGRQGGSQLNALGIGVCVLIDADSAVLGAVSSLLESVGVPKVEAFDDGEQAWKWLEANPEPGLILLEWRLPGLNGPLLLQRIRELGFLNVPIVVMSSAIKANEMPLIKELGIDSVVPKPFGQQLFFRNVIWSLQQSQAPTEQKSLERKMRKLLVAGRKPEAERLKWTYTQDRRVPTLAKKQVDAEFALYAGRYREARDLAIDALRLSGDPLLLLGLIGKTLLKLGDHLAALKFFEKANSISPLNVEHLCHMAVARFESGSHEEAAFLLQQARQLEPKSRIVDDLEVQHAVIKGNVEQAKQLLARGQSSISMISRLVDSIDARAAELTRSGRYDEGIRLYRHTLAALPGEWSEVHDVVAYNLGLAYARYGDLKEAVEALKTTVARTDSLLSAKAAALSRRIAQALEKGLPLSYDTVVADQGLGAGGAPAADDAGVQVTRGDVCLLGIFVAEPAADVRRLLDNMPRYQDRKDVERSEFPSVATGSRR